MWYEFDNTVAINDERSGDGKDFDYNLVAISKVEKKLLWRRSRDSRSGKAGRGIAARVSAQGGGLSSKAIYESN